ncbi:unnamed protein product [Lactuca saligna]|uniref:Uncharacterized protein n=1 Tax=Lactuca saligna TaxID=75948 RepID=A0AA35Y9W2_LACSI|nr:unnamed protein product [Lactuca saligna]
MVKQAFCSLPPQITTRLPEASSVSAPYVLLAHTRENVYIFQLVKTIASFAYKSFHVSIDCFNFFRLLICLCILLLLTLRLPFFLLPDSSMEINVRYVFFITGGGYYSFEEKEGRKTKRLMYSMEKRKKLKEQTENIPAVGNDFSGVVGGRRWVAAEEGGRRRWASSLGSPTVSSVAASLGGEKRT